MACPTRRGSGPNAILGASQAVARAAAIHCYISAASALGIDQGKLLGLISIGNLVKEIICEQKLIIDPFEHCITGERG